VSTTILFWGVVLTAHAACRSYAGLLTVRFLLGALESTITPGFLLFTSIWYRKEEQAQRVTAWLACNGVALLTMAPFAYGLSGVTDAAIASWEILFLILGLLTVCTGIFYVWYLPDNQTNARFLTHREKLVAIERIRGNFQGIGSRVWKWNQFFEAFRDPRTYLYVLFSLLMNIPNGGITTFGSLIIKSFGYNNRLSLLLQMPSGIVDIATKLITGYVSDRMLDRSVPAFVAILIPMIGGIMMTTIPLTAKPALLIGYYFISSAGASWGLVMVMISNNTLGYTKKTTVNGLQILAYGAGNWIGPQTFRASDAPDYYHGKLMVAIMYGLSACTLIMIRFVNIWENKRRDKAQGIEKGRPRPEPMVAESTDATETKASSSTENENSHFLDLTDFEQPDFRYVI
jgi:MFS family permease